MKAILPLEISVLIIYVYQDIKFHYYQCRPFFRFMDLSSSIFYRQKGKQKQAKRIRSDIRQGFEKPHLQTGSIPLSRFRAVRRNKPALSDLLKKE